MSFNAVVVEPDEHGEVEASVRQLDDDELPEGSVEVDIEFSTVNYKDGLCLTGGGGLVKTYPHVPGIDFAGVVRSSTDERYAPGDPVVLTGWRVGEVHWGGFSQRARVEADWLVPLPDGLTTRQAMAVGTAGFAAALAVDSLERHGLRPNAGEVLVTGAAGGVGSVAVALLANLGYQVVAVTGRPRTSAYLEGLGAVRVIARDDLSTPTRRPLESERWAGCVDSVGGSTLARVLGQMRYGSSVASVGLAGGDRLDASVIPFLLRAVNLLGIDSVFCPLDRRMTVWDRIAAELPTERLDQMFDVIDLNEVADTGRAILDGAVRGRIVIDVNR